MVFSSMGSLKDDPRELARRLADQKKDIEKLGYALALIVPNRSEVDDTVHRVNAWIDDAIECLNAIELDEK
jgi:hypothetical protein